MADKAQIESDDVAAVRVRKTGERDIRERKTSIEDLRVLRSAAGEVTECFKNSSRRPHVFPKQVYNDQEVEKVSEIQKGCNSCSLDKMCLWTPTAVHAD